MSDYRIEKLKKQYPGYWAERILTQISYASEVSNVSGNKFLGLIEEVTVNLATQAEKDQAITREAALAAESQLSSISTDAKKFKMLCAGHAHIDMNWMWGFNETVSITLDTFRTALDLMNEYPDFRFSQSQASTYQIVEEYDPQMLEEIKTRVKEGRWEVAASTWVEADKNMPNGESHARHLLYTRRYLSKLLDLKASDFLLDFEPDTFGHHDNVPEILSQAGVKYYYHCRGDNSWFLYKWVSRSGRSVIVYREPIWYLGYIEPSMVLYVPEFAKQTGIDTVLKVYGVGDHGGGPTRRDLERIQDMATWPVFPEIRFGTYKEYFQYVEKFSDKLPVMEGELNFVFTGCYTTQTRIKLSNRMAENSLVEAESFSAAAATANGFKYRTDDFASSWKKTLFNQFHDIVTGSGIIETREYALGAFQQVMACTASQKTQAFRCLTKQEQTRANPDVSGSISEGAGVGFGVANFQLAQVSRGGGSDRTFYFFNSTPVSRREVAEVVVWDWNSEIKRMVFQDVSGKPVEFQILDNGWNQYWGHNYVRVCLMVEVPAFGFSAVVLSEDKRDKAVKYYPLDPRIENPFNPVMENENIKVTFDENSLDVISIIDKTNNEELVDGKRKAGFRLILEDQKDMTAWVVGRYMSVKPAGEQTRVISFVRSNLKQVLTYVVPMGRSSLKVEVTLNTGSKRLEYAIECDWQEIGKTGEGIPQLNYWVPLNYSTPTYLCDIPFGTAERKSQHLDISANNFILGQRSDGKAGDSSIMLISGAGYGFRGVDDSLGLTLIRSSFDPDPHPELGIHKMRFSVGVVDSVSDLSAYIQSVAEYAHPFIAYSAKGMPLAPASFMQVKDGVAAFSALKMAEDCLTGNEWIVRMYETEGKNSPVELAFFKPVAKAYFVDLHENPIDDSDVTIKDNSVKFTLKPFCIGTLRVKFS